MLEVLSGIDNPKKYGIKYNVYVLEIKCDIFWEMIFLHHFSLPRKAQWKSADVNGSTRKKNSL